MRISIIIYILIFGIALSATAQLHSDAIDRQLLDQQNNYLGKASEQKAVVQVNAGFEGASNAISNSFLKAYLFNGNITNADKDVVSKRMSASNRLGFETNFSLNGIYHASKISFLAGIGHRELLEAKFTAPVFETIFRGNKMFAGQEVSLASNASYLNYDYLYFGASKAMGNFNIYATAQLIRGGQWMQADLSKADMYTQTDGEYIELDTKLKVSYSNNNFTTFPATAGTGAAINLGITWQNDRHKFNIEARDLGFIQWRSQTVLTADSSYRYEGVEVTNLLKTSVFNTDNINIDTLSQKFKAPKTTESLLQLLPNNFLINYSYKATERVIIFLGAKYISRTSYIPKITLRAQITFAKTWHVVPSVSYGGFGNQALEVGLMKTFKKTFIVSANLFYIEYLLLPKQSGGCGLNFSIAKIF